MIYRYQNLTIDIELNMIELHQLEINEAVNRHTKAALSGICESDVYGDTRETKVVISDGENGIVFAGRICSLEQRWMGDVVWFELCADSYSSILDRKIQTRVVQNQNRTYRQLFTLIMDEYPSAFLGGGKELDSKLPPLIVQNKETDWEIIKRLTFKLGLPLVTNSTSERVQLFAGLTGDKEELGEYDSFEERFLLDSGIRLISIRTSKHYHPGYRLRFKGLWYYVTECICQLVQGETVYDLKLEQEEKIHETHQEWEEQEGIQISAYIKEVKENQFRLNFEKEDFFTADNNPWFPYSGEVNNAAGFYMSAPGTRVTVMCTSQHEAFAVVTGAVRQTAGNSMVSTVTDKIMKNENGVGFFIGNEEVQFQANTAARLSVLADGTVLLDSENIQIQADKNLTLDCQNTIEIEAGHQVLIVSGKDGCGQFAFDEIGNIRCKSTTGLIYKSSIPSNKDYRNIQKQVKGLREKTMALAGTEFLAQSIDGVSDASSGGNYIKESILNNDERLFCAFSYGENKNGG